METPARRDFRLQLRDRSTLPYPRLHIPLHCVRPVSISSVKPSPEISNRPRGSRFPALIAQTASAPIRTPSASLLRCVARRLGERWQVPRGTGQTNMDLRKTLISVLWILLLKLEEDCHAEEGMWKRVYVWGFFFLGGLVFTQTALRSGQRWSTGVRGGDSLAFAPVRWGEAGALFPMVRCHE